MLSYYKLIECVERIVPFTYVNSLGFENTCGSASSTPFAVSKTEDFYPTACLFTAAYSALSTPYFTCF